MRQSLRKGSKAFKKYSSKLVKLMKFSKILLCLSMNKEPWLVTYFFFHFFSFLLLYSFIFCTCSWYLMSLNIFCRWYWFQHWELPCSNCTSKVSTCKSFKNTKIKFIFGNIQVSYCNLVLSANLNLLPWHEFIYMSEPNKRTIDLTQFCRACFIEALLTWKVELVI